MTMKFWNNSIYIYRINIHFTEKDIWEFDRNTPLSVRLSATKKHPKIGKSENKLYNKLKSIIKLNLINILK